MATHPTKLPSNTSLRWGGSWTNISRPIAMVTWKTRPWTRSSCISETLLAPLVTLNDEGGVLRGRRHRLQRRQRRGCLAGPTANKPPARRPGLRERVGGLLKDTVGLRSDGHDRGEANENDHGQHDGVFNSGWTVFRSQKRSRGPGELFHEQAPKRYGQWVTRHISSRLNKVWPPFGSLAVSSNAWRWSDPHCSSRVALYG